eukprot:916679-Prorocentrum_minimum.AAC.1
MPFRVEWDDSDESDEESDLLIDPDDENYHITIDEEQGRGRTRTSRTEARRGPPRPRHQQGKPEN